MGTVLLLFVFLAVHLLAGESKWANEAIPIHHDVWKCSFDFSTNAILSLPTPYQPCVSAPLPSFQRLRRGGLHYCR